MSFHYYVVQFETREQAQLVRSLCQEALMSAIAGGKACFDKKMHIVSSNAVLRSTHEALEALIREQSNEKDG